MLAGPGSGAATGPLVCVVAGRPGGDDGAALLASDGFRQAVAGLRDANELVLVEGPPTGSDGSLSAAAAAVEATVVCAGSPSGPYLAVPVDGLVVQPDGPQRS
jgi:hypothetical protein